MIRKPEVGRAGSGSHASGIREISIDRYDQKYAQESDRHFLWLGIARFVARIGLEAHSRLVEPAGSERIVFLRFGKREIVVWVRYRHSFNGDSLVLRPRTECVHLFGRRRGERLQGPIAVLPEHSVGGI